MHARHRHTSAGTIRSPPHQGRGTLAGAALPWPLIVMGACSVGLIMNAYDAYGRAPIREEDIQRAIERMRGA